MSRIEELKALMEKALKAVHDLATVECPRKDYIEALKDIEGDCEMAIAACRDDEERENAEEPEMQDKG